MNLRKVGISLIGLPGSGKTSIGKGLHLPGYHVHDMDNNGLENTNELLHSRAI